MPKNQIIKKSALAPTILISGGAGFIGSHLAEALLETKARVIVVDNFNTGKEIHVKHLLKNSNFALFNANINQGIPEDIESVDYIFHLAGLEEYLFSKEYLNLDSLLTNSLGTKNLLDLAKKSGSKMLLASTIDIYQGRMSQVNLKEYFGFSLLEENKYSLIESKRFAEALLWEYYKKFELDLRVVRLPEVYGPKMNLEASGSLGHFLKALIEKRHLVIEGDGTEKEYYMYITDVISGLIKALFNPDTKGKIYPLVPKEPATVLEIAYLLRGLADGEAEVQFQSRSGGLRPSLNIPDTFNLRGLDWRPKMKIKEGVMKTLEWFGYSVNQNTFKPAKHIEYKKTISPVVPQKELFSLKGAVKADDEDIVLKKKHLKKAPKLPKVPKIKIKAPKIKSPYVWAGTAVILSAFLVFLVVPSIQTFFSLKKGVAALQKLKVSAGQLDSKQISAESYNGVKGFSSAKKSLSRLKWVFIATGNSPRYITYDKTLGSLAYFSRAGYSLASGIKPFESLWEIIRPDTDNVLNVAMLENAKLEISNAKDYINYAEADYIYINKSLLPKKYHEEFEEYGEALDLIQDNLDIGWNLISDLPNILGVGEEKKYIIWFQNSNEIRPTGGFIGSYGVLKFKDGKLVDLVIDDIYNPDGQLDVRDIVVMPPGPILEFLEEDRLYMRNSNWNPDFTKSVLAFEDLYYRVSGDKVDGFIAVDLNFVESLMTVTGPVFLAAYNEEINSENLYERAQFHSDYNYEEGSSQKRSFLTVLGSKLLEKLFSLKRDSLPGLLTEVEKALNQKHLLVTFSNSPFNVSLSKKGWDGSLVSTAGDYLYVVNANLGGTKSNYYVKNKISYEVDSLTRDGLLRANVSLNYTHTAEKDAWPGGPYTNYVRVLTQSGSKLTGAKIVQDEEELDIFDSVVISKIGNYNSYAASFTLESGGSLTLTFSYDLPTGLSITKESSNYTLYWQKQPGTQNDEFEFAFKPPFAMETVDYSTDLVSSDDVVKTFGFLNEDLGYFIKFR